MRRCFFIVGPTSTGKSELAADVAHQIGAEIVSADAFQIYRGLDLLTAKPDSSTLAKAPHHLIGTTPLRDEMNAEKYRRAALRAIDEINSRCKLAIVVGGSGLYVKALTHGLAPVPESDPEMRQKLNAMSLNDLRSQLVELDPETARKIDLKNRRRVVRALEICLATGKSTSAQRQQWIGDAGHARSGGVQPAGEAMWRSPLLETTQTGLSASPATGVFVFRDRNELYERINQRVETMFERGAIEEVCAAGATSATASQMIGLREICELHAGKKSLSQCIAEIQQATRRYAKRQLTWFRRQTSFSPLNLSFLTHNEAVKSISLRIRSEASTKDD
ncbi:MAG TPA: tRNA (adenosine(37)-N6)-dimethylallyltransferase MiaA [Candidatus Udaeobacter sp.]